MQSVSTTGCLRRAAIRRTAAIRRWARTRFSSGISCLPVQIGAYSFEHGHTQKVRFDVTADVLRVTTSPGGHAPRLLLRRHHGRHPHHRRARPCAAERGAWPSRWPRMCWRIRASCASPSGWKSWSSAPAASASRSSGGGSSSSRRRCGRARCPEATTKASGRGKKGVTS